MPCIRPVLMIIQIEIMYLELSIKKTFRDAKNVDKNTVNECNIKILVIFMLFCPNFCKAFVGFWHIL